MKLYLGSRDYKPAGFLTVDSNAEYQPDICADVLDLEQLRDGTVEEVCASHILEHIPWPNSYLALAEWARVLKVGGVLRLAVPDARLLCKMVVENRNPFHALALLYGVGRLENHLEAHVFGYTTEMLASLLTTLGFGEFDHWSHEMADASNGWMPDLNGGKVAISLNLKATKIGPPMVEVTKVHAMLMEKRMDDFMEVVQQADPHIETILRQRLHMMFIDLKQRCRYLETLVRK